MARIPFRRFRPGIRGPALAARTGSGRRVALFRLLQLDERRTTVPLGWRNIAAALLRQNPGPGARPPAQARINGWLLVCAAVKIPHLFLPRGPSSRLYVPALYERIALREIGAFERERPPVFFQAPLRERPWLICCFFLLLFAWHALRFHWLAFVSLPAPLFPFPPSAWAERFGLDIFKVWFSGEWWRCATALTLHTDGAHLAGNLLFGLLFSLPLCRRTGAGLGLLLIVLAGLCGNALNVAFRHGPMISLGFSTALFGAVGGLGYLAGADALGGSSPGGDPPPPLSGRRLAGLFWPLAAGMALLGFLGGGAEERTDYAAHIAGFGAGFLLAIPTLPLEVLLRGLSPGREAAVQILLGLGAVLTLCLAWVYALAA
jgi:membrane associated rhomboid family serine protease